MRRGAEPILPRFSPIFPPDQFKLFSSLCLSLHVAPERAKFVPSETPKRVGNVFIYLSSRSLRPSGWTLLAHGPFMVNTHFAVTSHEIYNSANRASLGPGRVRTWLFTFNILFFQCFFYVLGPPLCPAFTFYNDQLLFVRTRASLPPRETGPASPVMQLWGGRGNVNFRCTGDPTNPLAERRERFRWGYAILAHTPWITASDDPPVDLPQAVVRYSLYNPTHHLPRHTSFIMTVIIDYAPISFLFFITSNFFFCRAFFPPSFFFHIFSFYILIHAPLACVGLR